MKALARLFKRFSVKPGMLIMLVVLCIPLFIFSTYSNSLSNRFAYDDTNQILNNPWITGPHFILDILTTHTWGFDEMFVMYPAYYRPLMHLTYMLEYHIFGLSKFYFHCTNLLLHTINSILVFILLIKIQKTLHKKEVVHHKQIFVAGLASLLFAVHPINSEVVNWIAALPELTYTLFFLLSFLFYIQETKLGRITSIAFFTLTLLSKETAVTYIIFLLLYNLFLTPSDKPLTSRVLTWFKKDAPFILLCLFFFTVRYFILNQSPLREHPSLLLSALEKLGIMMATPEILFLYIKKIFLPQGFSILYNYTFDSWFTICSNSLVILSFLLLRRSKKINFTSIPKKYWFGFFLFIIPLLPALDLYALNVSTLSDRYIYLPSVGLFFLISLFLFDFLKNHFKKTFIILIPLCIISLALLTHQRNKDWINTDTLMRSSLSVFPESALSYNMLSFNYAFQGDIPAYTSNKDSLLRLFNKQKIPIPDWHQLNLAYTDGYIHLVNKDPMYALTRYEDALRLNEKFRIPHYGKLKSIILRDKAIAYFSMGDTLNAQLLLQEMYRQEPENPLSHRALAQYYCAIEKNDEADKYFASALSYGDLRERIEFLKGHCAPEFDFIETFRITNSFMLD